MMDFTGIGLAEIVFVLIIALLVVGPRRLPEIGGMIGKAVRRAKMTTTELTRTINTEVELEKQESQQTIQDITAEISSEAKDIKTDLDIK
ncbi:MAG: hypothetical protein HOC20_01210 [Chloroflexi bacterium]|jgi:Tat protein translocase TatB subunit|nr:hypothetical protein [Chloroflexota bacterium]